MYCELTQIIIWVMGNHGQEEKQIESIIRKKMNK